jgi:hypothetical protein
MNVMRSLAIAAAVAALGGCGVSAAAADEVIDTSDAMAAANGWLAHVDRGRGREAYEAAAESFRKGVEQLKWEVAVDTVRNTLGNVVARKLRTATYSRTLPGAPDGEYVVIYFDTRFERKALATELVTTEREKDGAWRVGGYWVK